MGLLVHSGIPNSNGNGPRKMDMSKAERKHPSQDSGLRFGLRRAT